MSEMSEDSADKGLIVGVRKNPDGSLDMSHAMHMLPGAEISDPIVDRLRGPLQIDAEKESRYQKFQDSIQQKTKEGDLTQWFVDLMNQIKPKELPDVDMQDLSSFQLITDAPEIQELRNQYGHDYKRPYFQLNLADYQRVYQKLTGHLGSNRCTVGGRAIG